MRCPHGIDIDAYCAECENEWFDAHYRPYHHAHCSCCDCNPPDTQEEE